MQTSSNRPLISLGQNPTYDEESLEYQDPKVARAIRHGFIKKVYGIVATQLFLSAAVGTFVTANVAASDWMLTRGTPLILFSAIMAAILSFVVMCFPTVAESYPQNYIVLFLFTGFESIALGGLCNRVAYTSGGMAVLLALVSTCIVVIGLTLFAFQTKYDFISWVGGLTVVCLAVMTFGFARLFFPFSPVAEAIYASLMALVSSVYIVIDTQLIIGRGIMKRGNDQYIVAAMTLYIDIVNLFVQILRLLELLNRRRD